MRQLSKRNFSSCSQHQYLLKQHNSNFFEVKQKNYKVHGSWMRVNRRSTLVLKPFISSDSQKLVNTISGCWRSGKNWERITQPNATAQTLGVWGVNYWVKLWSIHFERWSIELNTVQPLILVKNLCNNRTIIRVPYIYVITNCNQSRPILLTSNFYNIVVSK